MTIAQCDKVAIPAWPTRLRSRHLMNSEIFIYALCDPDTKERRYIGKARDLEARVRCHRWEAHSSKLHTRKVNWLRSLGKDPFVEVLEVCSQDTWQEAERRWIAEGRAQGLNLTNYADGGQTSPVEGRGHSEESKERMRQASLRNGTRPPSRKGQTPWNKGLKGTASPNFGMFRLGQPAWNKGVKSTHCPAGHQYTPENTRIHIRVSENRSYQACKACDRIRRLNYRLRRAA